MYWVITIRSLTRGQSLPPFGDLRKAKFVRNNEKLEQQ